MDDLLEEFIAETRDTLEILSGQLVQWERTPDEHMLIDSVFRFVHTVKGSCGFLDLPRLLRLSHAAEDLLSSAREGTVQVSAGLVTAVLAVIDQIAALVEALESGQAVQDVDADLIEAMLAYIPEVNEPPANGLRTTPSKLADEYHEHIDVVTGKPKTRSVRISLHLLDKLMSGVSDMVLARNEVSRQLRKTGVNSDLDHSFGRLSSSVADMRDAVSFMRMQNIDRLFSSLPRILRDIAVELDKEIELSIEGSEVEVDREMVEALRDPLTHIIRNAADHGIEDPATRRLAGKASVGRIKIVARQSGNQILVEISDDGRGIDLDKLASKAIAAQLVTAAAWQKLGEKAQLAMIFTPGLSTADQVSTISGRGVGMDVVRNNILAVGGSIELENFSGIGLKMTLRLPLTLSIIAGISVRAGDQIFGISRNSVVEILSTSSKNVKIENIGSKQIACVRERRMPYAKLETILDIADGPEILGASRTLVVMRPAIGSAYVLDVASVIDNEELVVRPGAPLIMATGLYSGTSLPDNGRPMLLLDASGLAAAIGAEEGDIYAINHKEADATSSKRSDKMQSALLFFATDGTKQAVRLSAIERMEDIGASNISFVGGKWRVDCDAKLVDIFGLNEKPSTDFVKALRLSDGKDSKYLAVDDVLDIFTIDGEVAESAYPELHEGVLNFGGDTIELINIFQYFDRPFGFDSRDAKSALCYIECGDDAAWERGILGPLLAASGYQVSFDPLHRSVATIVLSRNEAKDDARVLRIHDENSDANDDLSAVYLRDRLGLLSAVAKKLSVAA